MSHAGRFIWRELISTHTDKAGAFYTQLFGWESAAMDMPTGAYTLFKQGEADVAGMMAPQMDGVPSHWLDYISVDDVAASRAIVEKAGGKAITPVIEMPVGTFAVVTDPAGAVFALFRGTNPGATDTDSPPAVGTFCWSHLRSSNLDAVVPFYAKVFGWTAASNNGMVFFNRGDKTIAGAEQLPAGDPSPSHWLKYVAVDDTDASLKKAGALGAKTVVPATTIEGMGRFAVLADPSGGIVALWKNLGAHA